MNHIFWKRQYRKLHILTIGDLLGGAALCLVGAVLSALLIEEDWHVPEAVDSENAEEE